MSVCRQVMVVGALVASVTGHADGRDRPAHGVTSLIREARYDSSRGVYFSDLEGGRRAELTLNHAIQTQLHRILGSARVQAGAIVAMEPRSGRILGLVETSRQPAEALATTASAPAASIFKLVTAAALLEVGVPPERVVCFPESDREIAAGDLADDPSRDKRCTSMAPAFAFSVNQYFGRLAGRELDARLLSEMASRFLFNRPMWVTTGGPADERLMSSAKIPEEPLGFARAAAGFGPVRMSPLHGAVLASIIANGGWAMPPTIVQATWTGDERTAPTSGEGERVIAPQIAARLSDMMAGAARWGTGRKTFNADDEWEFGYLQVAGKTGSLTEQNPLRRYSWFVGFAPPASPTVALAVLVVDGPNEATKATVLAKLAFEAYFEATAPK